VKKKVTREDMRAMRERFENDVAGAVVSRPDLSLDRIAEMFGTDRREVYAIRKRRGLPRRTNGKKGPRVSPVKKEITQS
jgi:hypothetical protein